MQKRKIKKINSTVRHACADPDNSNGGGGGGGGKLVPVFLLGIKRLLVIYQRRSGAPVPLHPSCLRPYQSFHISTTYHILGNPGVTHSVPNDECSGYEMGHAWVTEDGRIRDFLYQRVLGHMYCQARLLLYIN